MAKLISDIKQKRAHLGNLQKTYNRLVQLKMARTVEERNNNFLRKVNLLRLESLRVFQDSNVQLRNTEARLQEIAFLSAETLSRMHTELLTPERYAKIRSTQQGQIYAMHLLFSDYICVYLFGTLLLTLEGKSCWGSQKVTSFSQVCRENLKQVLSKITLLLKPTLIADSVISDMAAMINIDPAKLSNFLSFGDLHTNNTPSQIESNLQSCKSVYQQLLTKIPVRVYENDDRRDFDFLSEIDTERKNVPSQPNKKRNQDSNSKLIDRFTKI